jgi:hypothetical protein
MEQHNEAQISCERKGDFPMNSLFWPVLGTLVLLVVFLTLSTIRVVQQYERGVIFVLRTFLSIVMPTPIGWTLIGSSALIAIFIGRILKSSLLTAGKPQSDLPARAESQVVVQM